MLAPMPLVYAAPAENALKGVLIIVLFFTTFLASISAFALKRFARGEGGTPQPRRSSGSVENGEGDLTTEVAPHRRTFTNLFSLISCFGAGVFLSVCLLDLLPDSIESVQRVEKIMGKEFSLPLPELGLAAGFLFILLLEQTIIYVNERQWLTGSDRQHLLGHSHTPHSQRRHSSHHTPTPNETSGNTVGDEEEEEDEHIDPEAHSTVRAVLLVFALSLHAVFEGLSLGLISDISTLLQISIALLIHKTVVGFSLGVRLVQSSLTTLAIVLCCAVFSGQVVIGGLLGIVLTDLMTKSPQSAQHLITGILTAVACGTFLYITCFEILPHELRQKHGNRPLMMLCLIAGFVLIALFVPIERVKASYGRMGIVMILTLIVVALTAILLLKRYLGLILSILLAKYLRCNVKLRECSLLSLGNGKLTFPNGLSIELEKCQLSSSLTSQDCTKPLYLSVDDVRVETSHSATVFGDSQAGENSESSDKYLEEKLYAFRLSKGQEGSREHAVKDTTKSLKRILQLLQYFGAKIGAINFVLLESLPGCLVHISLEGTELETYRDKEGVQVELSCKLLQIKLFARNTQRPVVEIGLAGSFSVHVGERSLKVRRYALVLNEPRIAVSDAIFGHLPEILQAIRKMDLSKSLGASRTAPTINVESTQAVPTQPLNLIIEIDSVVISFNAISSHDQSNTQQKQMRSLVFSLCNFHLDFSKTTPDEWSCSFNLRDFNIQDQSSVSAICCQYVCITLVQQLLATNGTKPSAESTRMAVTAQLYSPSIVAFHSDLSWWIVYGQQLGSSRLVIASRQRSAKAAAESSRVAERGFSLQVELNDSVVELRGANGSITLGTALTTFSSEAQQLEFGVETLWCHWGNGNEATQQHRKREDIAELEQAAGDFHCWGTILAVGAGLAQLTTLSDEARHRELCIQLDMVTCEWDREMLTQAVEFSKVLLPLIRNSSPPSATPTPTAVHPSGSRSSQLPRLTVKMEATKVSLFVTARRTLYCLVSSESCRLELEKESEGCLSIFTCLENVRIHQSTIDLCEGGVKIRFSHCDDSPLSGETSDCGGFENLRLQLTRDAQQCEVQVHCKSAIELLWSTHIHLVVYEAIKTIHMIVIKELAKLWKKDEIVPTVEGVEMPPERRKSKWHMRIISEGPMQLGFRMPRNHLMRWIVPSLRFECVPGAFTLSAPQFLLEMDWNIIVSVEQPCIQLTPSDSLMSQGRLEFNHLRASSNKLWTWSADQFQIVFPYGYSFADCFEEVVNCVKWVKLVHEYVPKPFTTDSPLPADVRIKIKRASLQLDDDPFEIQLQNIYGVMVDEIFERERRKQMLDSKVAELKKENPLFPKTKMDALYQSLIKKDAQIYAERIGKMKQEQSAQQVQRSLFLWSINDLEIRAYADPALHGRDNCIAYMRQFNPEAYFPAETMQFSTLWARCVEVDIAEGEMRFRDYPLPYMVTKDAHYWGTVVAAEHLAGDRSTRRQHIDMPEPWGRYTISRNMCPLKFYYDLESETGELSATYGPCWEPCLSMISLCWNDVNAPSKDPSEAMPFWDKIRMFLHGRFLMLCRKMTVSMLASPDPYNDTELIEMSWDNFEFEWITGELRFQTDLEVFMRTASKYDDNRMLHLPRLKCSIQLDWSTLGDQHDHHSSIPCAPDRLPDYSTDVSHDSYRSFRSEHLDLTFRLEVKPQQRMERQNPQLLLYSNTIKCLDFLNNTLTMVNRPVRRRGSNISFGTTPTRKRAQLSRHFKHLQLSVSMPKFMISYWMSFSSSVGFRMMGESLHLSCAAMLHSSAAGGDAAGEVHKRPRISWKISHMSAQLENARLHLFGDSRQPSSPLWGDSTTGDADDSFFIGLSRLNYVRESNPRRRSHFHQLPDPASTGSINIAAADMMAVHRLTVYDAQASWTIANRDICLVIAEGVNKAHLLRKILNNEAMKLFDFNAPQPFAQRQHDALIRLDSDTVKKSPTRSHHRLGSTGGPGVIGGHQRNRSSTHLPLLHHTSSVGVGLDDGEEMLWKLVDEAETGNLVAYSEETVEPLTDSLHGVALCSSDDVILLNWQIDLLNSQLALKTDGMAAAPGGGKGAEGFILVTASRASLSHRFHSPIWRHAQLLRKRSWIAALTGMQYFAPLVIADPASNPNPASTPTAEEAPPIPPPSTPPSAWKFRWLSKDIIEEKPQPSSADIPTSSRDVSDKVQDFSTTGEAVGGVVVEPELAREAGTSAHSEPTQPSIRPSPQLQRIASRCSCQLFFCYFSDILNMKKFDEIPKMSQEKQQSTPVRRFEEVDCFTLKHNMLEVCTNARQYQLILEIVSNLLLFVDPKKTRLEESRRRLWFKLSKKPKEAVSENIRKMQSELREYVSILRALERQSFFLNKELQVNPADASLHAENALLQAEIDDFKAKQSSCIDELALMISCYKERQMEEQIEAHRLSLLEHSADQDEQVQVARRFEVCFEDCIWRLMGNDGQISLAEVQIRNFFYTYTARIDNSGDHLLEIGMVKVLNLLPNSKYRETLVRLKLTEAGTTPHGEGESVSEMSDRTPALRVICRELPAVGGIGIKEHFEVNVAPMYAQITYRFFERMMGYFFLGGNIHKADQQNLDSDEQQVPQAFSLAKRLRGAVNVYNSFRSASKQSVGVQEISAARDEIDKMKERAEMNNMFLYIIIPSVPFIVSYKGNKEKNIEDVERANITLPMFEYHDKCWSWLDLALAVKQRCKRVLVQQYMTQKFTMRTRLDRPTTQSIEPIDEEEKKRIILGLTSASADHQMKRKK